MKDITVKAGDYGGDAISGQWVDADGVAVDLTGFTVYLKVWTLGDTATSIFSGEVTVEDAEEGLWSYDIVDGDFDTAGKYRGELQRTKAGAKVSSDTFRFIVEESPT